MTLQQVNYLATLQPPPDDPTIIYVVRAIKLEPLTNSRSNEQRSTWAYEGRAYNTRRGVPLTTKWFNDNHMNSPWRKKTILLHENHWFRVAVRSRDKQSAKMHPRPQATTVRSSETERPPACLSDCLIKFFDHVGLTRCSAVFKSERHSNPNFGKCITMIRRMKKFGHKNLRPSSFDLCGLEDNVLYLFQIKASHEHTKDVDNTHAICVFNSKIFDANIEDPLDFNIPNLNACCVGGECWVFLGLCKIATFRPKKWVHRFIRRFIPNQLSVLNI